MNPHDASFLKKFSSLIAGFVVLTLVLIFLAAGIYKRARGDTPPPEQVAATNARIAPAGGVYAGESGQMAKAAAAAAAAAQAQVAYDGTLDRSVIYDKLCKTCHATGAGGAPTLSHANWDSRVAQGFDTLVRHSIEGFTGNAGIMPPRGGNPSLSNEQIEATVRWMVDRLN